MGLLTLFVVLLAIGFASAGEEDYRKKREPAANELASSAWKSVTLTVDWLFSETTNPTAVSKTTLCTQKCVIITVPAPAPTTSTTILAKSAVAGPAVSVSCITIGDSTIEIPITPTSITTSSLTAAKTPSTFSAGTPDVVVTVTTSTTLEITIPPGESETEELSAPCTTDITITETLTKTKTWSSTVPVTATLVHTHLTTWTSKFVETYSTSTGQSTQVGFEETTETISTVSVKTQCSGSETDCEQWSSKTCTDEAGSQVAASGKTVAPIPSPSEENTQPPDYHSTLVASHSWITSVTPFPVSSENIPTDESSPPVSTGGDGQSDTGTMRDGATAVSAAGAAVATAGVGFGVLFGIMIAMA